MKKPFLGTAGGLEVMATADDSETVMTAGNPDESETGRYLITLNEGSKSFAKIKQMCKSKYGLKYADSNDFKKKPFNEEDIADAEMLFFNDLGIALLGPEDEEIAKRFKAQKLGATFDTESIVYASPMPNSPAGTWGIQQTQTPQSNYTGKNVKVAVLDTGFDLAHPDFAGRSVTHASFVPGVAVQDVHGHGTHCIGTSCGNVDSAGVRYGVAKNAKIFVGKVLGNDGRGAQSWILNAMSWAANQGCKVVSMSLGSPVNAAGHDSAYERAARFVMSKGGIVVAAAGNESKRSLGFIAPVGSPANCPSILAVAALDANMVGGSVVFKVANFSCGTKFGNVGNQVDIAGPGVGVYSSWPMPTRYHTTSGTSMATPHVAGLVALLWEQFPAFTPDQIIAQLFRNARRLPLPNTDIGVGLATAR
jgi:subtilisin family serine protease